MDTKSNLAATGVSSSEWMVIRASQELENGDIVFVGIGLPNLACNLARATHAPDLFLIYESGSVGAVPKRLPVSIGDPALVTNSLSIVSQADIFQTYLQAGRIEIGFLGGAQIDRYGNLNTTVIGDYHRPTVRLPGSGGACEIATHARKTLILMKMTPRSFVEKCDFVTSPGHIYGSKRETGVGKRSHGATVRPGGGPYRVITDLGVCEFRDGEMILTEVYSGVSREMVRKACGWDLKTASTLKTIEPPSVESIGLLREKLDPEKLYL